jgi:hypothetical protein
MTTLALRKQCTRQQRTSVFSHVHLSNNDTKTTTQASQPANHYGTVRGGM